jgi:uncharacterized protein YndB with AHSA1/START domain
MVDIAGELIAIHRETGPGKTPVGEGKVILLRRTYPADIEDVWDAISTAERISRWFLPVSGDLRLGGRYQLEGNAGGEVLVCDRPHLLRVSWVMGDPRPDTFSEVEVRLSRSEAGTLFELEHTATVPAEMWDQFGPGAVGVGWDGALLGLSLHLGSGTAVSIEDKEAWMVSEEARRFYTGSSEAWGKAYLASGASPDAVAAGVAATTAFYAPPPDA